MLAMTRGSLPFDERIDPRRLADQLAEALRRVDARDVIATVDRVSFRGGVFRSVSNWNVLVPFSHGELAGLYRSRWHVEVCQADSIPRCGLYPSARSAHSERGGAAATGPLVPGASSKHRRAVAMRIDSERPVPPRPQAA